MDDRVGVFRIRGHGRAVTQIDLELEPADGKHIMVAQDGVPYLLAIHEDTVQAVQIKHVPHALSEEEPAVSAADVRQGEAYVCLAMPADQYIRPRQLQDRSGRLDHQFQGEKSGRLLLAMEWCE